jgi:hypothetical protein
VLACLAGFGDALSDAAMARVEGDPVLSVMILGLSGRTSGMITPHGETLVGVCVPDVGCLSSFPLTPVSFWTASSIVVRSETS